MKTFVKIIHLLKTKDGRWLLNKPQRRAVIDEVLTHYLNN